MPRDLIERFASGPAQLRAACAGLTPQELQARPGPGQWSIHEVVVHVADMDAIALDRMKRIIAEDNPTLLSADETAYAQRLMYHEQSLEDALALIEVGRRQFARVLRQLPREAFDRFGTHNVAGRVTLSELVQSYADHLEHHLGFILQKRERLGKPINSAAQGS